MTEVKLVVLLISKVINESGTASFFTFSRDGTQWSKHFEKNLGVDSALFGSPSNSQRCFSGIQNINLFFSNRSTSFMFAYNQSQIVDIASTQVYGAQIKTFCLASCAIGEYFNGSVCLDCPTNFTGSQCLCQPLTYVNGSSCLSCHFSCYTCRNSLVDSCTSCDKETYFREKKGQKCVPIRGYF